MYILITGIKNPSEAAIRKRHQRDKENKIKEKNRERKQKERLHKMTEIEKRKKRLLQQQASKRRINLTNNVNSQINMKSFSNKMKKSRALKKLRSSLPKSPEMRVSTVAAYLEYAKSPTIVTLQENDIIVSPEDKHEKQLGVAVLEDLKQSISETKLKRTDGARSAMNVLSVAISGESVHKLRSKVSLAKKLQVPIRRVSSGFSLRTKISHSLASSHEYTKRKVRSDAISDEHKKLMHDFWCAPDNSHPTGNKNDIKRVRIGPKNYSSHPVQILEKTQSEIYLEFREKYPDLKVSQSVFERCKPYFVRAASQKDRMTCCCRYHLEFKYVFKSVMNYRKTVNKDLRTEDRLPIYDTANDICNETLCAPDENGLHEKNCLDRSCSKCGVKLLNFADNELQTEGDIENVQWECFEYRDIKSKNGLRKKLLLVKKNTKPGEMTAYFKKLLETFPFHNFRAKWQNQQLKRLVTNLPLNHVITVHDYSENYRCKDKTELQSSYFQKNEASLHVTLLYRHALLEVDGIDSTEENPNVVCEFFLSYLMMKSTTSTLRFKFKNTLLNTYLQYRTMLKLCMSSVTAVVVNTRVDIA